MAPPIPPEIRALILRWHEQAPTLSSDEIAHRAFVSPESVRRLLAERYGGAYARRIIEARGGGRIAAD